MKFGGTCIQRVHRLRAVIVKDGIFLQRRKFLHLAHLYDTLLQPAILLLFFDHDEVMHATTHYSGCTRPPFFILFFNAHYPINPLKEHTLVVVLAIYT